MPLILEFVWFRELLFSLKTDVFQYVSWWRDLAVGRSLLLEHLPKECCGDSLTVNRPPTLSVKRRTLYHCVIVSSSHMSAKILFNYFIIIGPKPGQPSNCPPIFWKTYLVVRHNNKFLRCSLISLPPENSTSSNNSAPPRKYQLVAAPFSYLNKWVSYVCRSGD